MPNIFSFALGLLQSALVLLGFVHTNPALPPQLLPTLQANTNTTVVQPEQTTPVVSADSFSASPLSGPAPLTVTFSTPALPECPMGNLSCLNRDDGPRINFGDGNTTSPRFGATFAHTYATTGTYLVREVSYTTGRDIATVTIVVAGVSGDISVPGMSKYTDSDFGFSFWYPSSWSVKVGQDFLELFDSSGRDTYLVVQKENLQGGRLSLSGSACGPAEGCADLTYYFDSAAHTWMEQRGVQSPMPTNVSTNTMGGLHMLNGNVRFGLSTVIPLSAHHFLIVGAAPGGFGGGEHNIQDYLAKTIVATDPSVATPVSAAEQTATIQAEKDAYAGQ